MKHLTTLLIGIIFIFYFTACSTAVRRPSSTTSTPSGFPNLASNFQRVSSQAEASLAYREGLGLYYAPNGASYAGDSINFQLSGISQAASSKLAKMVIEEFQLYPTQCLQKVNLDQIVLVNTIGIAFSDGSVDSRSATLDPQNNTMIYSESLFSQAPSIAEVLRYYNYDLDAYNKLVASNRTESYFLTFLAQQKAKLDAELIKTNASVSSMTAFMVNVIHHEFYHFWDMKVNGFVTPDPEWAALNPSDFQYGNGGRFNRGPTDAIWNSNYPGFLDNYARSAVEEDKAETFGALMAHPVELEARMEADPILARKVALLKSRAQKFCPAMNNNFWNTVDQTANGRIKFGTTILTTDDNSAASLTIPSIATLRQAQ